MNTRVKKVRTELKLTQKQFGERLGVKDNTITQIELGNRGVSNQMLVSICREFNVSMDYLKDGIEPIFITPETSEEAIDALITSSNPFVRATLQRLANLGDDGWAALEAAYNAFKKAGL